MELRSVVAGKRSYSPDDVLFAFISGGLDYDCACCGAKCCRGFGYALDGDQALHQLERRPHLRYFVEYKNGRTLAKNLPPACFFLTDSGRCEIQESDGYLAKPETCRLFPFNNIRAVGRHLIVQPHVELCPLLVRDASAPSPRSQHQALIEELLVKRYEGKIPMHAPIEGAGEDVVALERHMLTLTALHQGLPYLRLVAAQHDATRDLGFDAVKLAGPERVKQWHLAATALLGVPLEEMDGDTVVDSVMTAATPYLRSSLVFRDPASFRKGCDRETRLADVPSILLAMHLLCQAARLAGMRSMNLQSVARLFEQHHALLYLLATADRRMFLRENAPVDIVGVPPEFRGLYIDAVRELSRPRGRTISEVLVSLLAQADASPIQRAQCLSFLAAQLHGRLTAVPGRFRPARLDKRVGRAMTMWLIRNVDTETMCGIAERWQSRPPRGASRPRSTP